MPRQAVVSSGRRRAINTKITDELREALEAAAVENNTTLSGEIERRLERSFEIDRASDPSTKALGEAVVTMVGFHQIALGQSWTEDPRVARYIFGRVKNLLARSMRVKLDPEDFDDDAERAEAAAIDADADEHDAQEASRERRWPSAAEGEGEGILARLLNVPMWPAKLKERYRS